MYEKQGASKVIGEHSDAIVMIITQLHLSIHHFTLVLHYKIDEQ